MDNNAGEEELIQLLSSGHAKNGMYEGNIKKGELEIGQVSTLIKLILPLTDIVNEI